MYNRILLVTRAFTCDYVDSLYTWPKSPRQWFPLSGKGKHNHSIRYLNHLRKKYFKPKKLPWGVVHLNTQLPICQDPKLNNYFHPRGQKRKLGDNLLKKALWVLFLNKMPLSFKCHRLDVDTLFCFRSEEFLKKTFL